MEYTQVSTPCGEIKGVVESDVNVFKGVRYARAARFEYPKVITEYPGLYDATKFGAACPQYRYYYDEVINNAFYHNEFRKGSTFSYDEDCLFLNIYAPKAVTNAPVIVYIHGGNHTKGSSDETVYQSYEYAKRGVILVTINYRLNVFGLFASKEFAENNAIGGFQFYDQLAAITWVKNNIAAFGGNAQNITLMGQSAGAMSIQPLILSPKIKNMVSGAIMLSGGGVRVGPWKVRRVQQTLKYWQSVQRLAGCGSAEELKKVEAKVLFDAWNKSNPIKKLMYTLPYADGQLITKPLKQMQKEDRGVLPVIIGVTKNDMVPYILYRDAVRYARVQKKRGGICYLSYFSRNLPGTDGKGAFHSSDLWYALGTLKNSARPFTDKDYRLSDTMVTYYCNFAATQNPNGGGLAKWDKAEGKNKFMNFDTDGVKMCAAPKGKLFLNTVAPAGERR